MNEYIIKKDQANIRNKVIIAKRSEKSRKVQTR